jgi:DNA-binding LytR/AlgR family response regulator
MDKIIIINDNKIEEQLERFLAANRQNIRLVSDMDEMALARNPVLKEIIQQYEQKHKLRITSDDQVWLFRSSEIVWIEREKNSLVVHLRSWKTEKVDLPVAKLMPQLEGFPFVQVHPDYIINLNYLATVHEKDAKVVDLTDGTSLPIGRHYRSAIKKVLMKYLASGKDTVGLNV